VDATVNGDRLRRAIARRFSREEAEGLTLTVGFLACAAIVLVFSLLARRVFALSGTDPLDHEITLWARSLPLPGGSEAARAVTLFGGLPFVLSATFVTVAALALRNRRVSAMLFSASVLGGFGLETILKLVFHRARPDLVAPLAREATYSFPSGHATMATVFFGGLAALVFHVSRRPAARTAAVLGAAFAVFSVALSRVYLGLHWLTDVAAGILVGLFWVVVSATATEMVAARRPRVSANDPG
jgi:membrane-associated phospholipid phosphatase